MKKVNILRIAKIQSILFLLIGLLCGVIYSFGGLLIDSLVSLGLASGEYWSTPGLSYGTILAFGALLGMPTIGAIVGFLAGIIEGILYNLVGRRIKWFKSSDRLF